MATRTAAPSFLGYEYQALQALLLVLPTGTDSKVYIERFDDVVFEGDNVKQLIQNKFSLKNDSKITSIEPAFWKSVGNWIDLINAGIISEDEYHFLIITTRDTDDDLILQLAEEPENRKNDEILTELNQIAEKNKEKNEQTKKHIKKFLNLRVDKKIALVSKIQVLTGQSDITQIQNKINDHLKDHSHSEFYEGFFDSIYGWWYRQIINRLSGDVNKPLTHKDLIEAIQYHRDRQTAKALPIYFDKAEKPEKLIDAYNKFRFVRQLNIIDLEKESVVHAMLNYYLASEHRSKWVRDLSHVIPSLNEYDEQLKEKWLSEFNSQQREIKKLKIDDVNKLKEYGLKIFEWMDKYGYYPDLKLEKEIAKMWMWKGSFHMLSDKCEVGWHPNFKDLAGCKKDES